MFTPAGLSNSNNKETIEINKSYLKKNVQAASNSFVTHNLSGNSTRVNKIGPTGVYPDNGINGRIACQWFVSQDTPLNPKNIYLELPIVVESNNLVPGPTLAIWNAYDQRPDLFIQAMYAFLDIIYKIKIYINGTEIITDGGTDFNVMQMKYYLANLPKNRTEELLAAQLGLPYSVNTSMVAFRGKFQTIEEVGDRKCLYNSESQLYRKHYGGANINSSTSFLRVNQTKNLIIPLYMIIPFFNQDRFIPPDVVLQVDILFNSIVSIPYNLVMPTPQINASGTEIAYTNLVFQGVIDTNKFNLTIVQQTDFKNFKLLDSFKAPSYQTLTINNIVQRQLSNSKTMVAEFELQQKIPKTIIIFFTAPTLQQTQNSNLNVYTSASPVSRSHSSLEITSGLLKSTPLPYKIYQLKIWIPTSNKILFEYDQRTILIPGPFNLSFFDDLHSYLYNNLLEEEYYLLKNNLPWKNKSKQTSNFIKIPINLGNEESNEYMNTLKIEMTLDFDQNIPYSTIFSQIDFNVYLENYKYYKFEHNKLVLSEYTPFDQLTYKRKYEEYYQQDTE